MVDSGIEGVIVEPIRNHSDQRGVLFEMYRNDELPSGFRPVMSYLSYTKPGVARGPHEHVKQTDGFVFIDGEYELYLWENREGKGEAKSVLKVGEANPVLVIVPPGVVHAYKNVGDKDAYVLNFPDQLYAGEGKKEPVDEIRHEDQENSRFQL